jgi:hypothetical protein
MARTHLLAIAVAGLATTAFVSPAAAQARIEVGVLRCDVAGGVGLILGSRRTMTCVFQRPGADEVYTGRITRIGVDVGVTRRARIIWAVFAPTRALPPASLAGRYAGVSAEATVGLGVGANALIGGSRRSVILQPVSVQAQTGLNIAAGVSGLVLRAR